MDLQQKIAAGLGCALEWFDFVIYGFLSTILAKTFFPATQSDLTNLINTFGIFAIGFLARPLGGLIFGYFSDRLGRALILKYIPLALGFFTASIGFIPSYTHIGIFSIIFLIMARFLQGICLGGECSNSIIYLVEASTRQKFFWGSIGSCAGGLGFILASLLSTIYFGLLAKNYPQSWRIIFFATFFMGLGIHFARSKMQETVKLIPSKRFLKNLIEEKKTILLIIGALAFYASMFYFSFMFIPQFLITARHMAAASSMAHNSLFLFIQLALIPVFGFLGDKINGAKLVRFNIILFSVAIIFLYSTITIASYQTIFYFMILFCIAVSVQAGLFPALIINNLPIKNRGLIFSFSFNVAFAVCGGLVPYICLLIIKYAGMGSLLPAYYLTSIGLISLISLYFLLRQGSEINVKYTLQSY